MCQKWDSRRNGGTYGSETIARACAECRETYNTCLAVPVSGGSDVPLVLQAEAMPASGGHH